METKESIDSNPETIETLHQKIEELESTVVNISNDFKSAIDNQEKRLDKAAHFLISQNKEITKLKEDQKIVDPVASIKLGSEDTVELFSALSKAILEYVDFKPTKKGQHGNDYANLSHIINCTKHALVNNDLSFYQELRSIDGKEYLVSQISHLPSKQWKKSILKLIVDQKRTTRDENQSFGSATTYAKRYAMATMLCYAYKDDPLDNDAGKYKKY